MNIYQNCAVAYILIVALTVMKLKMFTVMRKIRLKGR